VNEANEIYRNESGYALFVIDIQYNRKVYDITIF
jgi:hypothetical protein